MKTTYLVSPNFPPEICGIGDYSFFLHQNLEINNLETEIITFSDKTSQDEKVHCIKTIQISNYILNKNLSLY